MYFKLSVLIGILYLVNGDRRGARVRRIVGGLPADIPPVDDPVIYTRFNGKTARVQGVIESTNYVFKGIPYAHPPIGSERFLRPREKFLEGHINATKFPPPCFQPVPGRDTVVGNEDCLYLNVFSPELPTGMEGLPVVVWIHGGGFRYGSASQYGVRHLVGKRLIIVTIQYRLGSLGFLSSGTKELPGNAALWDMTLAVQWVRNYIGFFGGNPHKIVVMGHDVGASSALLVSLSKVAKGVASGIIAMSGTAVSHGAVDNAPSNTAKEIAEENGCPTKSIITMIKCLQNLQPDSIIKGDSHIEFQRLKYRGFVSGLSGGLGCAPVREGYHDGRSLPSLVEGEPLNDLYQQKHPKIPLLTGITKDETKKAVHGQYKPEIIEKLQTIPNFLDKVLVKNLQGFIGLNRLKDSTNGSQKTGGMFLPLLDPTNFKNYIQTRSSDINEGLAKISEATGDALFNVPAFLTADLWSKTGAPTFLYRFDHSGRRKKGISLLRGMPIVGNSSTDELPDTVGHGDELAYLFDVHDVEGKSLESTEALSNDDQKVREVFTQMVADFARFGSMHVGNQEVSPFSSKTNNFIQIKPTPVLANNFRFCEMALWCGLAERLKSTTCQFLLALDTQIKNVQKTLVDTVSGTNQQIGKLGIDKIVPNNNNFIGNTLDKKPFDLNIMKGNKSPNLPFGGLIGK